MGQQIDNESRTLQPGYRMIFGPFRNGLAQDARFTDSRGATLSFPATYHGDKAEVLEWVFIQPMNAHVCGFVANVIGLTFGMQTRPVRTKRQQPKKPRNADEDFAIAFCADPDNDSINRKAAQKIIFDRAHGQLTVVLAEKMIITRLTEAPIANAINVAEILAALHGFTYRQCNGKKTIWDNKPVNVTRPARRNNDGENL